jgi:hypothetical protein
MSKVDKKAALLGKRTGADTEDVAVPGLDITVTVRGLTRREMLRAQKGNEGDTEVTEARMLAAALVDPEMSVADVMAWQEASPGGEMEPVTQAVQRLSKVMPGDAKETYKSL